MDYKFEWDTAKASENIRKHQVSFRRAGKVFHDPCAVSTFDDEHSQDEERWLTIGRDKSEILLVVSHTFQKIDASLCQIRIISALKATKNERKQYEEVI